ncbi:hypothetical protein ABH935_009270 [Catenulispora sp. GAS73]|uniref:hypothetical protein n=1 Tax=Catenulispora sp. GAS73 TaxID=3156269 RepID=UPI0035147052
MNDVVTLFPLIPFDLDHLPGPLSFDPAAVGLRYGPAVFEGLKAHALSDGGVGVFRLDAVARRLAPTGNGFRATSGRACVSVL